MGVIPGHNQSIQYAIDAVTSIFKLSRLYVPVARSRQSSCDIRTSLKVLMTSQGQKHSKLLQVQRFVSYDQNRDKQGLERQSK